MSLKQRFENLQSEIKKDKTSGSNRNKEWIQRLTLLCHEMAIKLEESERIVFKAPEKDIFGRGLGLQWKENNTT